MRGRQSRLCDKHATQGIHHACRMYAGSGHERSIINFLSGGLLLTNQVWTNPLNDEDNAHTDENKTRGDKESGGEGIGGFV